MQSQTLGDWELLVCDDGSTDGSLSILREFASRDSRIRVLTSDGNEGPAKARNACIEASGGRYIAFLDSDDVWNPEKLEVQTKFMLAEQVAFSFSSYDRVDEGGRPLGTRVVKKPVTYHDLLKSCVIGCLTAIYDTQALGKMYMPDIRKRQDYGLWLRILKRVPYAIPLEESLAKYRVRADSISANKLVAARYTWSIYRDVERLSVPRSAYYFGHYALRGILNSRLVWDGER